MTNDKSLYKELLWAIDDDIEEEEISIFTCPYCGYMLIDDSSNFDPSRYNIGDREDMHQHIIDEHLEDLKSDYGCDNKE